MGSSLQGKVVLITGASSGFGADSARLFAQEGCRLILCARRLERLQALSNEIVAAGGDATPIQMDVSNAEQVGQVINLILQEYGHIDILFNNAGFGRMDWLENLEFKGDIHTQIAVNLTGLIQVTHAVLPSMIQHRRGHIINMSSVAGWIAPPLYSIYSTTKFGVRAFTESLRREVHHLGIRVSGIYPSGAETEFSQHTGNSSAKRSLKIPSWLKMSSNYVARKVISLARHPRPTVIIPWWMVPVIMFSRLFSPIVDWILVSFASWKHKP